MSQPPRHVWVEEIMAMPVSIHVRSRSVRPGPGVEHAVQRCFEELREVDRVFSTYRDDSDISRLRRGELAIAEADARVRSVQAACEEAALHTRGRFDANWRGWFDPTGYVKGWAVEEAARRHLAPLIDGEIAVGINAGGDMQLFTAADTDWRWSIGIADPRHPGAMIATIDVANGAVATSGTAERGHHIVDPRSGQPALEVVSATVVGDSLAHADVWATAAVVAGFDDRTWLAGAATRTGLLVADDGRITRWLGATAIDVVAAA